MTSDLFFWLFLGEFTVYPLLIISVMFCIPFTSKWFEKMLSKMQK